MPKPPPTADLRREYKFDYAKARPNRFAVRPAPKLVAVVPAPDVAKATTAPRALVAAMPRLRSTRKTK